MRRRAITALALLAAPGCHRDEQASSVPTGNFDSAEECQWRTAPEPEDSQRPLCDVEFREVVRLEGSLDGVIPETPVAVLRDGRFLTATYSRGDLLRDRPDPVHGRIWYRPTEDMLNFVILEAVLIER